MKEMKTNKWKTAFWIAVAGSILLLSLQEKQHKATLKQIRLHRAVVTVVDDTTDARLNPSIMVRGGPSSDNPLPSGTTWTSHGDAMVCEWVGIEPREIHISSEGYSTQSVVVASGTTNIIAALTKLKKPDIEQPDGAVTQESAPSAAP